MNANSVYLRALSASVSHPAAITGRYAKAASKETAPAHTTHPQVAKQGVMPCRVRLPRRWDNFPSDIAASATERWDTRYRNRHASQGAALRTTRDGSPRGAPASPRSVTQMAQGHQPAGPRPERHQGRVAQLTHNAALASSGRRAPHSTRSTVLTPSRDEWVGERGFSQRRDRWSSHCK